MGGDAVAWAATLGAATDGRGKRAVDLIGHQREGRGLPSEAHIIDVAVLVELGGAHLSLTSLRQSVVDLLRGGQTGGAGGGGVEGTAEERRAGARGDVMVGERTR